MTRLENRPAERNFMRVLASWGIFLALSLSAHIAGFALLAGATSTPARAQTAASNLDDLLYLRQVDMAVTQADVFDYFRNQPQP
jgi:hypothetical protein